MLQTYFETLTDERQTWKVKHNLLEIVVMTICAVIAGCDVWEDIEDFCRVKEQWLKENLHLELKNGLPSHDTMQRVWSMIHPEEFEKCFIQWVSSVCQRTDGEIVSIDGKTVRRSKDTDKNPIHMVSAWANQNQVVLGQLATDEKSNEITAVPELLAALDITGTIITTDAMSCQKEIVKKIIEKKADYTIALKENQPTLYEYVHDYFSSAITEKQFYPEVSSSQTTEKGHGRIERRTYYLSAEIEWLENRTDWAGLAAIGMVHSHVERNGVISEENRYYITSLVDVKQFASAVRSHWGVENSLHWCLDMTFHEDYSRIRKDHSAENMAVVRHMALNILKQHPAKISLARKRRRCSYDDAFLASVLLAFHA